MPTQGYGHNPWETDPRRWCACMRQAEADLLARGIHNSHRRWHDMRSSKARKLFAQGGTHHG